MSKMNRRAAVQYLHERHPHVIDPPFGEVDREALQLETLWFQAHTCDLMDELAELAVRRCFATIHHLLVHGDPDVQIAVPQHFVMPHLIFHDNLTWAQARMPDVLAGLVDRIRSSILRRALGPRDFDDS